MSKRGRRASSSASHDADDGDESDGQEHLSSLPSQRKRKKADPGELCQQIYDTLRCHRKEDGSLLCDFFIRAPKRRQEPHYYEVVSQPIDLLKIQQKLKTDSYEDVEDLSADIELLVNNAKAFYKPDTTEYKDAITLWSVFLQTKSNHENLTSEELKSTSRMSRLASTSRKSTASVDNVDAELSEASTNEEDEMFEELFVAVMSAQDGGRSLNTAFMNLPSKRQYPEYYEVIKQPIDLRMIAMKVQNCDYLSLADMEKDLMMMTKNACTFNETSSQIYKDAKNLKKLIQAKRVEIEHGKVQTPAKASERIRNKRSPRIANLTLSSAAVCAGAMADSDNERNEESDTESMDTPKDSAQWKLYETIKNLSGPHGPMCEPFNKLPSKRFYPDYYKEIKNPISLNQIHGKLRHGNYGTLSELAGDMNIMFENAKQYNVPTSRLYKDAVRMQKIMQQTVQEMLDIVQDSSSDDESLSSMKSNTNITPVVRGRGRPRLTPNPNVGPASAVSGSSPVAQPMTLKKKMHILQRHLIEYTCSDGRQPLLLFMEKPSKKLYPDYYNVIEKPIDMLTIESNIKNDRYTNMDQIIADFRLMFSNCRQYNEEGSMIYEDANLLERAMNEKLRELSTDRKTPVKVVNKLPKVKQLSPMEQKLRTLYDAIRDYREPKQNRQLALIFMKLPNKSEYPDYYELIKNPIDMEKIAQKLKGSCYSMVNELASDFVLMFDNACKYNEPDSQIYKDALVLQRICLQTKQMLREDEETVPDVPAAVQEILMSLFTMVYNHQDEEGRCFSDSMAELPEHDEVDGLRVRAISLDLIKRRLDKGLYKRLDHFQEDMFTVFERARTLSRVDSQVFEDAVELQMFYIKSRDQLCKDGTVLYSPALKVTQADLAASIELVKQCNILEDHTDEDNETRSSCDDSSIPTGGQAMPEAQYSKGEFVYYQNDKKKDPAILQVERVWTNTENVPTIYGNCYFRPHETFHVQTRRFLEQEVFKTDSHQSILLDQVVGKCCVMNVKDYFKFKPDGFADKDVYVCESRYYTRVRSFKKIKVWPTVGDSPFNLVPREHPLEPKRVMSVFRERIEKHKDELAELEVLENVQEKERPNVVVFNPLGGDDENTYFEQYNTVCSGVIKTGDYVYVVTDGGKQMIAQVDTMWETKDEKCYFRGPWLIQPSEVIGTINKVFYKQEVLLTAVYDSSPMIGIVGKCAVLHYDEYLKCRPTEIPESDVYVCEALYDESNRTSRKLKTGLGKYEHTDVVTPDEIYFFPRAFGPPPMANMSDLSAAPQLIRASNSQVEIQSNFYCNESLRPEDVEILLESSLDESSMASPGTPMSMGGGAVGSPANNPGSGTISLLSGGVNSGAPSPAIPSSASKKKKRDKNITGDKKFNDRKFTGYILYSREIRKSIIASNPVSSFGEISRLVGNEWRQLSTSIKQTWEEKAVKLNEEAAKILAEGGTPVLPFSNASLQLPTDKVPKGDVVYECLWDTCDYQFEDFADCSDHIIGHVQHLANINGVLQCLWRGCNRQKRQSTAGTPFPNVTRLTRHVRDQHINKGNGRSVPPPDRSKNFQVSRNKNKPSVIQHRPQSGGITTLGSSGGPQMSPQVSQGCPSPLQNVQTPRPMAPEPLFISVPPRPHRVQHSEAYIRYIEGLHSDQKYISPWEKSFVQMPANPVEGTNQNSAKILTTWFNEDIISNLNTASAQVNGENTNVSNGPNGVSASTLEPYQNPNVLKAIWNLKDLLIKDAFAIAKNL